MNDRPPSGSPIPTDSAADSSHAAYGTTPYGQSPYGGYETGGYPVTGYDGYSTGSYDTGVYQDPSTAEYGAQHGQGDALFGSPYPDGGPDTGAHAVAVGWDTGSYATGAYDVPNGAYDTGAYDTGTYSTGTYDTGAYPVGAYETGGYEPGGYEAAAWDTGGYPTAAHDPGAYDPNLYDTGSYGTAAYGQPAPQDTGSWNWTDTGQQATGLIPPQRDPQDPGSHAGAEWDSGAYGLAHEATGYDAAYDTGTYDTGTYDTGAYDTGTYDTGAYSTGGYDTGAWDATGWDTGALNTATYEGGPYEGAAYEQPAAAYGSAYEEVAHGQPDDLYSPYEDVTADALDAPDVPGTEAEPEPVAATPLHEGSIPPNRGRRRSAKPRRSALLTVAVPSVCVLGVAGIAAASVTSVTGEEKPGTEETTQSAPDPASAKPSSANDKLDTQLAGLSADADDFADRASRTQERIDLKERKEAERIRKAEAAAAQEAARPKFAAPVSGTGISAYFGQAGVNWLSVHTGIDFPVSYGTPVKAATDGTVRTQSDASYGNMAIVTAADGTETWYCHLSSTKIRAGTVQAGDVIAYSGNSGKSTGPHLHFEVRPGGGSAIDPLAWFRSHGIEPG
ncbi:peptidoglycan DD-metalloendopeptidase family protein [Streptomyces sp. N2-109]|uniref:Peptidoglycan DD-metalloendopeptidase family protein n=1 Tax=Streptomyces gossypii TaxID=2883101 RepID=A0ABT2JWR3_9ACTN|nr:peptidoglycan DD-metalloendopeptidase family protein [Streptomyces gossypii]MCT2592337.1 peptidoglycan DD-metalloendopeptidase family protein [Streptomyces gossypii]